MSDVQILPNMQNSPSHNPEEFPDELPPDTLLLHGQYQIERYLIRGGFGITYLARDSLDRRVVIKECFPNTICCRADGQVIAKMREKQDLFDSLLRHFLREARRLARLSHPNIVGVHQVFEENSTAYMALDYVDGMDLLSVVQDDPKRLTPEIIRSMLMKSLGAISYIHGKGILHRDISPDNFLLDGADKLTLIDFGAAREHATRENRALSSLLTVKDGYSPQEFYLSGVSQSPPSDLYALGATFYHLITGKAPPDSQIRLAAIAADNVDPFVPLVATTADYEPDFFNAINRSLEIFPEDRLQSAQDWVEAIDPERRRKAALARASKDISIRQKISKLVVETNRNLRAVVTAKEGSAKSDRPANVLSAEPLKEAKPVSKPVDMFGEPIDDVEAWLWAQDHIAEVEPEPSEPEPKPKIEESATMSRTSEPRPHPARRSGPRPSPAIKMNARSTPRPAPKPRPIWVTDPPVEAATSTAQPRLERPTLMHSLISRFSAMPIFPPKKPAKPLVEKEHP